MVTLVPFGQTQGLQLEQALALADLPPETTVIRFGILWLLSRTELQDGCAGRFQQ